jgi:polysaccharide biosynthesis/export protein
LTHLNSALAYNRDAGLRLGILMVALTATLLALSAKVSAAQTAPPPAEAPAKAPEQPTDKKKNEPSAAIKPNNTDAVAADEDAYRIGLDDQLMISVWREPELSLSVVVRPDGMITLPLLSDVHVVGLKPTELQQLLTEKLKPFVSEPQVTVIAQGIRSRKIYLVGNVSKQGTFNLEGGQTVLQLLASAGGVNPFAKADSIYILRMENKKQIRIPFQYKKALKGRTKDDVVLQPGDIIVVP